MLGLEGMSGEMKRADRIRKKHELSMADWAWEYLDELADEHGLARSRMAEQLIRESRYASSLPPRACSAVIASAKPVPAFKR